MPKGWVLEEREVIPPLNDSENGLTLITVSKDNIHVAIEDFRRCGHIRVRVIRDGKDLDRDELPDVAIDDTTISHKGSPAIIKTIWHTMSAEQVGNLIEGMDVKLQEGKGGNVDRREMLKTIDNLEMALTVLRSLTIEIIEGSAKDSDYKERMTDKTNYFVQVIKRRTSLLRYLLNPEE